MVSGAEIKVAPTKRGRIPALVNAAITVGLVLILTTLTLRALQSPPPEVAEFAPQVEQQIKEALGSQGGEIGGTEGEIGAGAAAPPPPVEQQVPSNLVKRCVGNPPRQIEDSQSPPCIPYWEGDNGGATYPGVTRDSICVTVTTGQGIGHDARLFEGWRRFFNQRFQLYKRQLVFQFCKTNQSDPHADAANAYQGCTSGRDSDADAYGAPTGHTPFAVPGYNANYYAFDKEIACNRHAIAVVGGTLADVYMRTPPNCFPYFWGYMMANENIFAIMGQWTCARLVGQVGRFADGTDGESPPGQLNSHVRKFGMIVTDIGEGEGDPTSTPAVYGKLLDELKACGVEIEPKHRYVTPGTNYNPAEVTSVLVQMKQDNVTSVFCMAVFGSCIAAMKQADNLPYLPEWLSSSYSGAEQALIQPTLPPNQRQNLFGLSMIPKQVPVPLAPWYRAIQEVDPSNSPPQDSSTYLINNQYKQLLLMASGIQMAGPKLTPQTFAEGLWKTKFPNPDTPIYQGNVGFAGQGLQMTIDAAEWFISNTAAGPYPDTPPGHGVACYIDHGARHSAGQWPKGSDDVFFTEACDSGG